MQSLFLRFWHWHFLHFLLHLRALTRRKLQLTVSSAKCWHPWSTCGWTSLPMQRTMRSMRHWAFCSAQRVQISTVCLLSACQPCSTRNWDTRHSPPHSWETKTWTLGFGAAIKGGAPREAKQWIQQCVSKGVLVCQHSGIQQELL